MRPVPGRDGAPGGAPGAAGRRAADGRRRRRARPPPRRRPGDARREHLRSRPDRVVGDRVGRSGGPRPLRAGGGDGVSIDHIYMTPPARASRPPQAPPAPVKPQVELTIDGTPISVPEGTTILQAARGLGIDTPTLCYLENLTPVNVCRVCVVEVAGSRVLAPACSRKVEPGMEVQTESERVRASRKVVLEFLASSVETSLAGPAKPDGEFGRYLERYGADP